jgi:hypothetical protein
MTHLKNVMYENHKYYRSINYVTIVTCTFLSLSLFNKEKILRVSYIYCPIVVAFRNVMRFILNDNVSIFVLIHVI